MDGYWILPFFYINIQLCLVHAEVVNTQDTSDIVVSGSDPGGDMITIQASQTTIGDLQLPDVSVSLTTASVAVEPASGADTAPVHITMVLRPRLPEPSTPDRRRRSVPEESGLCPHHPNLLLTDVVLGTVVHDQGLSSSSPVTLHMTGTTQPSVANFPLRPAGVCPICGPATLLLLVDSLASVPDADRCNNILAYDVNVDCTEAPAPTTELYRNPFSADALTLRMCNTQDVDGVLTTHMLLDNVQFVVGVPVWNRLSRLDVLRNSWLARSHVLLQEVMQTEPGCASEPTVWNLKEYISQLPVQEELLDEVGLQACVEQVENGLNNIMEALGHVIGQGQDMQAVWELLPDRRQQEKFCQFAAAQVGDVCNDPLRLARQDPQQETELFRRILEGLGPVGEWAEADVFGEVPDPSTFADEFPSYPISSPLMLFHFLESFGVPMPSQTIEAFLYESQAISDATLIQQLEEPEQPSPRECHLERVRTQIVQRGQEFFTGGAVAAAPETTASTTARKRRNVGEDAVVLGDCTSEPLYNDAPRQFQIVDGVLYMGLLPNPEQPADPSATPQVFWVVAAQISCPSCQASSDETENTETSRGVLEEPIELAGVVQLSDATARIASGVGQIVVGPALQSYVVVAGVQLQMESARSILECAVFCQQVSCYEYDWDRSTQVCDATVCEGGEWYDVEQECMAPA